MKKKSFCLGIDVSKKTLDCCLYNGKKKQVEKFNENSYSIVKKIVSFFRMNKEDCLVVMEATGIYHTNIFHGFFDLGFDVVVENPSKIKSFRNMKMFKTKTDAFDAYIIANYGFEQNPKTSIPKEKHQEEMTLYLKQIEDFNLDITRLKNRKEALDNNFSSTKDMKKSFEKMIKSFQEEVKKIKDKIKKLALKHFETIYKRMLSIVGVGEIMAASILAYYGDFSSFSNTKKVASFCGICPGIRQSGTSINGKGSITRKGNKDIRKSLYLCSLSASRYNKQCKDLYERLLLKGKSKKLALIAVGHKILRQIFGVIKNNLDFSPDYLNKAATTG